MLRMVSTEVYLELERLLQRYEQIPGFPLGKCRPVSEDAAYRTGLEVVHGWWIGPIGDGLFQRQFREIGLDVPKKPEHYWLRNPQTSQHIDLTARQFDSRLPRIFSVREPSKLVASLRSQVTDKTLLLAGIYDKPPSDPELIEYCGIHIYRWNTPARETVRKFW